MHCKHQYVYDQSSSLYFYDKLNTFREYFVDQSLMQGLALNGDSIENIFFETNTKHTAIFYSILREAFAKSQPFIQVDLFCKSRLEMQCCFYDFGTAESVPYIYMMQNSMDWTSRETFCCEILSLIEPSTETIRNFWNT